MMKMLILGRYLPIEVDSAALATPGLGVKLVFGTKWLKNLECNSVRTLELMLYPCLIL